MTQTGEPDVAELMAQLAASAAEIAALKAEKEALSQRVAKLEEELVLAKLHRFAPAAKSTSIASSTRPKRPQTRMIVIMATTSPILRIQACQQSIAPRVKAGPQTSAGRPAGRACRIRSTRRSKNLPLLRQSNASHGRGR